MLSTKTTAAVLGKDGKPFDKDRYVSWGLSGKSAMQLRPLNQQPHKVKPNKRPKKLKTLDELRGRTPTNGSR